MARTKIEWTRNTDGTPGETWNPLRGTQGTWHCVKISPGCANCYAERLNMSDRFHNGPAYQVGVDTMRLNEKVLQQPLSWRKGRICFVCSMTDMFHEEVPFEWIDRILNVIRNSSRSFFLILTKRIERALEYQQQSPPWPRNVGIGTSIETDEYAKRRIPSLLQIDAAMRFLSIEPLLEFVDLRPWLDVCTEACDHSQTFASDKGHRPAPSGIDWVIVGGESGPKARPMDIGHVRPIRDICLASQVPFFFKQWGEWTCELPGRDWLIGSKNGDTQWIGGQANPHQAYRIGRINAGRLLDNREWNEIPKVLEGHFENPLHSGLAGAAPPSADRRASSVPDAASLQVPAGPGSRTYQQQLF